MSIVRKVLIGAAMSAITAVPATISSSNKKRKVDVISIAGILMVIGTLVAILDNRAE